MGRRPNGGRADRRKTPGRLVSGIAHAGNRPRGEGFANKLASAGYRRPGGQSRFAAREAGVEGFAARPVPGRGPENFGTVFGRYASGSARMLLAGIAAGLWLTALLVRDAGLHAAAALAAESAACLSAAALALPCAPRLARPAFPAWALAPLPFDTMGRPGRWLRFVPMLPVGRR